jgi:heme o synthase
MTYSLKNKLINYLELGKLKIMVPVSLTGFTGYFILDHSLTGRIFIVSSGILLLAISASILNQLQEVELDRNMERTRKRPIPAGKISPQQATIIFFITLISGSIIVYWAGNAASAVIGLLTILWYNGVYTYLKKVTAFAVIPGALTGAMPPLIGWVAAGGDPWDKTILFVEFLVFIAQVPHFWILILKYGEEYEKAGIPALTSVLTRPQIKRLTFTWVVVTAVAALFLYNFGIIRTGFVLGVVLSASVILIWRFSGLLKPGSGGRSPGNYSRLLDSYFLLLLLLLISDKLLT